MKSLFVAPLAAVVAFTSASAQAKPAKPARLHFVVAPTGNEARYRVREQLAGIDLPNDAIGVTKDVTGQIVVDPTGKVVKDSSKIVVQLTNLKSDKSRRDGFFLCRTRQTPRSTLFPFATVPPTGARTAPASSAS